MKKLFVVFSLVVIGYSSQAQSVTSSSASGTTSAASAMSADDENYTIDVTVNGNDVYMTVTGVEFDPEAYYITDMQSNVVQQGQASATNNTMHIVLDPNLPSGDYMIIAKTRNNTFTHEMKRY